MASKPVLKIIRNVPVELKTRLVQEVESVDRSMNDIVVGILAERFGVSFIPTDRRRAQREIDPRAMLNVRMPEALSRKINVTAAREGRGASQVMVRELERHFDLGNSESPSRPRAAA